MQMHRIAGHLEIKLSQANHELVTALAERDEAAQAAKAAESLVTDLVTDLAEIIKAGSVPADRVEAICAKYAPLGNLISEARP